MANGAGEVYVFQKGFGQSSANLKPGDFFQKVDGTFWKVLADGSQVPFGGSGGDLPDPSGEPDGDVLTVASGAAVWAANGGSSSVQMTSVQVNSAQLLALDATPKVLLPAAGGRNYHVVHNLVFHYRFGTTPYTGDFTPKVGFGTVVGNIDYPAAGSWINYADLLFGAYLSAAGNALLQLSEDGYAYANPYLSGAVGYNSWKATEIENKAVILSNVPDTPLANGDGTLTVRVWYTTIDGA